MKRMTNKQRCRKCCHRKVCHYKEYFAGVDELGERCSDYKPDTPSKTSQNEKKTTKHLFPPIDGTTLTRLAAVIKDSKKCEAFADAFEEAMRTDDEKPARKGLHMGRAICNNNMDEFLVAVCGWSCNTLLNIAEFGVPYPNESDRERADNEEVAL